MSRKNSVDEVSRQIIAQLREDGRRAYAAIGKAVGLSEAAVRQRVQRLTETGAIRIVAVTDPARQGRTRQAMIGIRVDGALDPIADTLSEMDEVTRVVICAGSFDLLCEVACADDDQLRELIAQRIRPIPAVRNTETFVYFEQRKQT